MHSFKQLLKILKRLLTIDVSKVECFTNIELKRETGTSTEGFSTEKYVDRRLWEVVVELERDVVAKLTAEFWGAD